MARVWVCVTVSFALLAPDQVFAQLEGTPAELYAMACARCHASDGTGRVPAPTVTTPPMDFSDCAVTTPEPDADWDLVIRQGGPAAGLSSQMPAFGDVLADEQVTGLIAYIREFCVESGWPRGNLNFPLALITEKAFPENEFLIRPAVSHTGGDPVDFRLRAVYERRFGRRGHGEISLPLESVANGGARATGLADIALAGKYVLHADRAGTRILTAGLEIVLPTGSARRNLGTGTTVFEPYLAAGTTVRDVYLQGQFKLELPAREPWGDREVVYNLYVGRDLAAVPTTWTLGVEVNGVEDQLAFTPQVRKGLTRTGALAGAVGVRIPVVNRSSQTTSYVGYLLWEYLDPVRARP